MNRPLSDHFRTPAKRARVKATCEYRSETVQRVYFYIWREKNPFDRTTANVNHAFLKFVYMTIDKKEGANIDKKTLERLHQKMIEEIQDFAIILMDINGNILS